MSKVTNNVLGPINVKSYKQSTGTNNILGPINVKNYKQYIRSNKCQQLQTIY